MINKVRVFVWPLCFWNVSILPFVLCFQNFEEYPEHRTNFFVLLHAVNSNCFDAFLNIEPAQFKLVLDSVIWAFKHTMRNVADTGLTIMYQMLQNVGNRAQAAQSFYQTYYTDILQHIFSVVTDSSHTAGSFAPSTTQHNVLLTMSIYTSLCWQVSACTRPSWRTCSHWWKPTR